MGCSSFESTKDDDNIKNNDIANVLLNYYINESKIRSLLKDEKNKKNEIDNYEQYYLINKFWIEDYLSYFNYKQIISTIGSGDYLFCEKNFDKLINDICKNHENQRLLKNIKLKNIPEYITKLSRTNTDMVNLNKGRAKFPNINTSLIKKEVFYLMIRLLSIKDKISNDIFDIIIRNKQIYIKIEKKSFNLLICIYDQENLRTKYIISFDKENNFKEIIKKYIIQNELEQHLENKKDDRIKEQDLIINNKKIGSFFNLTQDNKNPKNNVKIKNLVNDRGKHIIYEEKNASSEDSNYNILNDNDKNLCLERKKNEINNNDRNISNFPQVIQEKEINKKSQNIMSNYNNNHNNNNNYDNNNNYNNNNYYNNNNNYNNNNYNNNNFNNNNLNNNNFNNNNSNYNNNINNNNNDNNDNNNNNNNNNYDNNNNNNYNYNNNNNNNNNYNNNYNYNNNNNNNNYNNN